MSYLADLISRKCNFWEPKTKTGSDGFFHPLEMSSLLGVAGLGRWFHCMRTPLKTEDSEEGEEWEAPKAVEPRPWWGSTGSGWHAPQDTLKMLWKSFSSASAQGRCLVRNPVKWTSFTAPFASAFESVIRERCDSNRQQDVVLFSFSDEKPYEQGPCLQHAVYS